MIPFPLIVLGIATTTLGLRHLRKKDQCNTVKEVDENRKRIEMWCKSEGLVSTSDGTFDLNAHLSNGNSLIIEALIQDFKNTFEFLIEQKVDVNAMNSEGKTALFYCKNNNQIEKLIKAGADVNARDLQGKTVLFDCKNLDLAKVFVDAGVDVNARDLQGKTALFDCKNLDLAKVFVAAGVDVNARDSEERTALFYCNNVDLVKVFLAAGIDVNARDLQGRTAIFDCRNMQIAEILLIAGADLLIQDKEGKTVLHTLSTAPNDINLSLRFVRIYVAHTHILLNITDNMGEKAEICGLYLKEEQYEEALDDEDNKILLELSGDALLDDAVEKGKYKLAKIALERGANPNCKHRNQTKWNMLVLTVRNNNPEFIPLLVQYGADVNEKRDNISVLCHAVMDYHPECVKALLDCGAKIDASIISMAEYCIHPEIYSMICKTDKMPPCKDIPKDADLRKCSRSELNSYLISAINAYDIEAVHRLLNAGADPNTQGSYHNVLEIATEKNAPDMIQALVDAGADINKQSKCGTVLSWACYYHHDRCVELLLKLGARGNDYTLEHSECTRIREIWRMYKQ